jgi:hypothetical protein
LLNRYPVTTKDSIFVTLLTLQRASFRFLDSVSQVRL